MIKGLRNAFAFFIKFTLSLCFATGIFIYLSALFIKENINDNSVVTTYYEVASAKVSSDFRIVQLSDLHDFNNIDGIINAIKDANPDIIVTTGDMFDGNRPDLQNTVSLYQRIVDLGYPVFYTAGNHEMSKPELWENLKEQLSSIHVTVMTNEVKTFSLKDQEVNIIAFDNDAKYSASKMSSINPDNGNYNIVLCHYPENFNKLLESEELYYGEELPYEMNLILSGHAHGGQIRVGNQGLFAPNQGYLPKWTSGIHKLTDYEFLVINRGLGNSAFPFRINNPSEIVIVDVIHSL